jgi:hypothetical protein
MSLLSPSKAKLISTLLIIAAMWTAHKVEDLVVVSYVFASIIVHFFIDHRLKASNKALQPTAADPGVSDG